MGLVLQPVPAQSSSNGGDAGGSNIAKPCIEPQPVIRWEDYHGPLQNVESLARKLDPDSDRQRAYKPDKALCSLEVKDRFVAFAQNTLDPIALISAGFSAGIDHLSRRDPTFKMGASGYTKRLGAELASQSAWRFVVDLGLPTLFGEDPRYYRLGEGGTKKRTLHALKHVFIAHHENGSPMFNYSEWIGTSAAVALSNTYHPGNQQGIGVIGEKVSFIVVEDMGMDVLKEFWPDLVHKLHMPFRVRNDPVTAR